MIVPGLVLLYFVSPIDIIPDWIPIIGYFDDLALIALAIPMLITEAEKFIAWETAQKGSGKVIDAEIID